MIKENEEVPAEFATCIICKHCEPYPHMKAMQHYSAVCLYKGVKPIDIGQKACKHYESAVNSAGSKMIDFLKESK